MIKTSVTTRVQYSNEIERIIFSNKRASALRYFGISIFAMIAALGAWHFL